MVAGPKTRVFFVASDGTETDISACVTGVAVELQVGKPNRARLECIKVVGTVQAELVDVTVRELRVRRPGWRRRLREVSSFGQRVRTYA